MGKNQPDLAADNVLHVGGHEGKNRILRRGRQTANLLVDE
jgi:hypothetical protein